MTIDPEERSLLEAEQEIMSEGTPGEPGVKAVEVARIGGCSQLTAGNEYIASTVLCLGMPGLDFISGSFAVVKSDLRYEPTYLTYREGPALVKALDMIEVRPDVLLVPATGRDHPRGSGMARHVGALLSLPTVGVTRENLAGEMGVEFDPGNGRAAIYVSPGWGIDSEESLRLVEMSMGGHRMPEPIYLAKQECRARCSNSPVNF